MSQRYEIRFSGAGGQGLILAGVIMAEAASIYDGKQAVQSQSYGPEARGGASKSEVIVSDDLIDSDMVTRVPAGNFKTVAFPIINTAKNEVGREIVANIVALGAMVALTGVVTKDAAEKAVLARVPEAFMELNKKAFQTGYDKATAAQA